MELPVHVGQVIAGKYEVERILARGGVGVVVKAKHTTLLEPCAIKLMLPEVADIPLARERFLREARACARLKGDHVVRVFDVGELDGETPYMVLEYLEGIDLDDYMGERRVPVAETARYALQICAGLAEAHALGIVHRDLKPANVFLARMPDGTVRIKLLDFGISKLLGDPSGADPTTTLEGTIMGTPFYMAPEQVQGTAVDARTDVWAVGVLLYHLLTARVPFAGDHLTATFQAILDRDPIPPSVHLPSLPAPFEAIILRCLEKAPARRPASVQEIAGAVAPFAAADEPAASPRRVRAPASASPASPRPASALPTSPPPASPPPTSRLPASSPPRSPPPASRLPASSPPRSPPPASRLPASSPPASAAPPTTRAPSRGAPGGAPSRAHADAASTRAVVVDPARARTRWAVPLAIAACVAAAVLAAALAPRAPAASRDGSLPTTITKPLPTLPREKIAAPEPAFEAREETAAPEPSHVAAPDAGPAPSAPAPASARVPSPVPDPKRKSDTGTAPQEAPWPPRGSAPPASVPAAPAPAPSAPAPAPSIPAPAAPAGPHATSLPPSAGFELGNRQ